MAATLLAAVVAIALGHLAPGLAAAVRRFEGFGHWLRWLGAQFPEGSFWRSRWGLMLAVTPPLLVMAGLQVGLQRVLWGLPGLMLGMVVLFLCWGPRDLDGDVTAILDAPDADAQRVEAGRLFVGGVAPSMEGPVLVEAVFGNALRRWWGPLFWFCLLGPVGALLYRLSALAVEHGSDALPAATADGAGVWLALLDWPVVQLATLALALVGNFDAVAATWRVQGAMGLRGGLLGSAARASVRSEIAEEVADRADAGLPVAVVLAEAFGNFPELRDAMSLAWRVLVLWLAVLALIVVAGWVG